MTSGYLDLVQRLEFGVDHLQKCGISNRISITIAYILYTNVL